MVWIIVMFLSAVWTLILTAPIHCRGYIGEQASKFLHVSFNEETNSSTVHVDLVQYTWMAWGWVYFQQMFIFGWAIKGLVHPKMKILSLITHPHVLPDVFDEIGELCIFKTVHVTTSVLRRYENTFFCAKKTKHNLLNHSSPPSYVFRHFDQMT